MTKWLLVCAALAAVAFLAQPVSAQEQIAPPQGPAVSSSSTVPVMPARTGLFGRIRERRGMVTYSGYTGMTPAGTYSPTLGTTPPSGIQQAQALEVVPTPMTTPTTQMTTQTTVVERRGLFSRLRARRY